MRESMSANDSEARQKHFQTTRILASTFKRNFDSMLFFYYFDYYMCIVIESGERGYY